MRLVPHRGEPEAKGPRVTGQSRVVVVDVELVGGRVSSCPPKRFVDDVPSLSLFSLL